MQQHASANWSVHSKGEKSGPKRLHQSIKADQVYGSECILLLSHWDVIVDEIVKKSGSATEYVDWAMKA